MVKKSSNSENRFNIAKWIPPLSVAGGLCIWELIVRLGNYPPFILPAPSRIAQRFVSASKSGILWPNVWVTFYEVLLGLLIGTAAALVAGYFLAHSPVAEKIIFPYVVVSQAVPLAAIAPLLIIWFGSGVRPKVVICSLTVFFPLLINILVGYRELERNLSDLMTSMKAGRLARLVYLEFPGILPVLLGGFRISATLSVIGAVVGELSGADAGLGYLINIGRGQYDTALVFVALLMLMIIALVLYGCVLLLEKRLLVWNKKDE
ncbi:MAG: ABC transporter permease [Anaerolineaceae bacterium]|nr:ABC transporter permease [Anaerolineaceae bacterium]